MFSHAEELILALFSISKRNCIFIERKRFTGEDLAVCSRTRNCVTGQHERRVELKVGQDAILAGHCPLTGHYFKSWYQKSSCHYESILDVKNQSYNGTNLLVTFQ